MYRSRPMSFRSGPRSTPGSALSSSATGFWSSTPISCCRRMLRRERSNERRLDPTKALRDRPGSLSGLAFAGDRFRRRRDLYASGKSIFLRDFPIGARIQVPSEIARPCRRRLRSVAVTSSSGTPARPIVRDYPADERGTAEGSDLLHALRWPRRDRELIPDLVAIELGTDSAGDVGVNWAGRRTPEFSAEGGPYRK